MGEENKEEEKKEEEKKEKGKEEKKEKEVVSQEWEFKVYMHCEACARKVERSLRGFEGVEDVKTDYNTHKVVVKGKTADPAKVCERIQKKSGRSVEIISPLPKPPEEEKKEDDKKEEKTEPPQVMTVILNVHMHCEACAQVLQKRIRKMDGVESVVPDIMNHQVIVKGILDPTKLVEKVYKKTRKQASIVKDEEKKEDKKEKKEKKEEKEGEDDKKDNAKKMEYWASRYYTEYSYPSQIFSDENPNACSLM